MKRSLLLVVPCALAGLGAFALLRDELSGPAPAVVRTSEPGAGASAPQGPPAHAPRTDASTATAPGRPSDPPSDRDDATPLDRNLEAAYLKRIEALTRLLAERPNQVSALLERAMHYATLGRLAEALADLDRALALDPGSAAAYGLRADVLEALGRREEARVDRERAEELDKAPVLPFPVTVMGVVVDAGGTPVTGATVTVSVERGAPIPPVDIGPSGAFQVVLPEGSAPLDLAARAPGYARTSVELPKSMWHADGPSTVDLGVIRLESGATLTVTLRSKDGEPLAGVVRLDRTSPDRATNEAVVDGRAVLGELKAGRYRVRASAPDHAPSAPVEVHVQPGAALEVPIVLERGARVVGRVVDPTGAPVPARIMIGEASTVAGADGEFALGGVAAGDVELLAVHERGVAVAKLALALGAERAVDVVLGPGARVQGRVLRAGVPQAGAFLLFQRRETPNQGQDIGGVFVFAGPDGAFEASGLLPGTWDVGVDGGRMLRTVSTLALGPGQVVVRDVVVDGGVVTGVVVQDGASSPRGVWRVLATLDGEVVGVADGEGEDGRFELELLPPGRLALLATTADGQVALAWVELGPEGRVDGVVLRLGPGAKLRVRVLDPSGAPVPGAQVRVSAVDPPSRRTRTTDEAGVAEAERLVDGRYRVEVPEQALRSLAARLGVASLTVAPVTADVTDGVAAPAEVVLRLVPGP